MQQNNFIFQCMAVSYIEILSQRDSLHILLHLLQLLQLINIIVCQSFSVCSLSQPMLFYLLACCRRSAAWRWTI